MRRERRKKFGGCWRKFLYLFASAKADTRQSLVNAECLVYCTRHYNIFAECPKLTLGEACFCRVLPSWHSANNNGNGRGNGNVRGNDVCGARDRVCRVSTVGHSAKIYLPNVPL